MGPHLQKAAPVLPAPDVPATLAWYRDKLGFAIRGEWDGQYGIVERDGVELHFWKSADRALAEASGAYLRTVDADALHASMQGAADGGRISAPSDRPWGVREFEVWDPNGNLLRIGQLL